MQAFQKPGQIVNPVRGYNVIPMQSPERLPLDSKSQNKLQTYLTSPYMQQAAWESQRHINGPANGQLVPTRSPAKMIQSMKSKENIKLPIKSMEKIEYAKTTNEDFERYSYKSKRDSSFTVLTKSPPQDQTVKNLNFGVIPSSRSQDITNISINLRELLSSVQRHLGGQISDELNDRMIEILSSFRKFESTIDQEPAANQEDYNKLRGIMDQMSAKMTNLVQENQKLNKSLMDQEQLLNQEVSKRQQAEDNMNQAKREFNRVFECLQINQKENEEYKQKYQSLLNEYQTQESRITQQKSQIKQTPQTHNKSDLEMKVLQLQIENDNIRAQMAHNLVDTKVIENKNEMIQKLEDKMRQVLNERSQAEEQFQHDLKNYEQVIDQVKLTLAQTQQDLSNLQRVKQDLEKESKTQLNKLMEQLKNTEQGSQTQKIENQKLKEELKIQVQKLNDNLNAQNRIIDQANNELNQTKIEFKKTAERNSQLQQQIDQMSKQIQHQTQLYQSLMQQNEQYKKQEQILRSEFERADQSWKQQKQDMNLQMGELNEQLSMYFRKYEQKDKEFGELLEETKTMKEQYEIQKRVYQENAFDLERRLKNAKIAQEDIIQIKENEINDLKISMEQQIKMLEKRNALAQYDQQELETRESQLEQIKIELEKSKSQNFNLQEELLRSGMLITQLQTQTQTLKQELNQSKQEQQHLLEMLKKRKEEIDLLHQNLEEIRKDKKNGQEDSRKSHLKMDYENTIQQLQRDNLQLQQKLTSIQNELNRKNRELVEKTEEVAHQRKKYDDLLDKMDKHWAEKKR